MKKLKPSTIVSYGVTSILLLLALSSCFAPNSGALTSDEKIWLQQHKGRLEVLFGYEAPPNAYYNEDEQYVGLLVDLLREIESHIGINFSFRNFDSWDELIEYSTTARDFIVVGIARTDERAKYLSFTAPFVKVPYVIVSRKDSTLTAMSDLIGNKVCTVANYAINDYIAQNFPHIKPQGVVDNIVGLRKVSTGDCDAFIVNQMYASYLIENQGISNLKISGESGYLNRLSAATSIQDPRLFNILEKAVDGIGINRQKTLYRKWVSTNDNSISQSVFLVLGIISLAVISLLVLFWLWTMSLRKQARIQTRQIREDKERLELTVHAAQLGYYDWQIEQGLLHWDEQMDKIFGLSTESTVNRNEYFFSVLHADDKQRIVNDFNNIMDPDCRSTSHVSEYKIQLPKGQIKHIETYGSHVRSKDGKVVSVIGTCRDITDRRTAEYEKERLQRELQQAHKMEAIGQLTGGIAHDFNNMLGVIMGYTEMALDHYGHEVPEKMRTYLETAMKASEQARDLVGQMLIFSRTNNGDALPLQLAPLVKENIKILHSILPSSIKIELDCEHDLPNILIDPAQLQQMMMNLCVNARDAMDGIGTLSVKLGWRRNINDECCICHKIVKDDWIELSVSDTGVGMTAEVLAHLFEPFYTTKEIGKGTGMGLSVLQGIVNGHNAHILIETEPGKGTSFCLLFPPSANNATNVPESNKYFSSDKLVQGEGRHVLVVDDEPELAEYIGTLLRQYGYQITVKTDSQEALSLFQEDPDKFAFLVTDQTMPNLTGVELIQKISAMKPNCPVILCSGYSEGIDAESAKKMGICYLSKPIDAKRLVRTVGELLGLTEI
ncbi:MAG: ATP-binding protein [Gammaproteobacteria bacterium]